MSPGERIKTIRKGERLSQAKFAKEIGYSQGYIKDIELGKVKPSRRVLEAISQRFDVSIDFLLKGDVPPQGKPPKYPGLRDVLLIAYEGNDKEKIEGLLSEGEYTLFERLITTNTVHIVLDASVDDHRFQDAILRQFAYFKPEYKGDESLNLVEDALFLDNIPKLKRLATFAFAEGPEALLECFYQLFSAHLEFWDFDFDTATLKIKLYNRDFKSVPLLISEPQLLFSDETMALSNRLSDSLIATIEEIESSLPDEQRKTLHELLTNGIEIIAKRAVNEYLKQKP